MRMINYWWVCDTSLIALLGDNFNSFLDSSISFEAFKKEGSYN